MKAWRRLPGGAPDHTGRRLWGAFVVALVAGLVCWLLNYGFVALWLFALAAVFVAVALPLPYALVSPLFMGLAGWLVDMLPFVILCGWGAVVVRWFVSVVRERRLPRGGIAMWLAVFLVAWTAIGVLVVSPEDLRGFLLLLGIQGVLSGTVLAVVDRLRDLEARLQVTSALVVYAIALSLGVLLQWAGVDLEALQDRSVAARAEAAYGVDAFPNNLGMIKWARATESGARELRERLGEVDKENPDLPEYRAFRPKFAAFPGTLIVRFEGSARPYEAPLREAGVELAFDNVGMAPANTVPRLRSFPRNALTFAGMSAALFPLAFGLAAASDERRRRLGWAGVVATLFGVGFSLARGAWIAVLVGIVYLAVDGAVERRWKIRAAAAFLLAALVLSATYLVNYGVDPVTGRAGGGASVNTRGELYGETLDALRGIHLLVGFGTTQARTETGTTRGGEVGRKYVPRAGTHSTYLNYLFRTGVPGALAIAGLYALAALSARARAYGRDARPERSFASFATAAVVTAAAHAVILSLYVEPVYTLTVALVLGIALATKGEAPLTLARRRSGA